MDTFFSLFLIGCAGKPVTIEARLLSEIIRYIERSEKKASKDLTYGETDIYLVKFYDLDSGDYIRIFENNLYIKDKLDGYINIGDNKVFFYNSDKRFVDKQNLSKRNLSEVPDEYSMEINIGFNSENIYFQINPDLSLRKIHDDSFILDW